MASTILCSDESEGGYEWSLEVEGDIVSFHDRSWDAGCEHDYTVDARWSLEAFRNCIERFCACCNRAMLIERGRLDCMERRSALDCASHPPEPLQEIASCLEVARDDQGTVFLCVSGRGGWVSRRAPASFWANLMFDDVAGVRDTHADRRAAECRTHARRALETDWLRETDLVVVTSPRDPAEGSRRHAVRFAFFRPRDLPATQPQRAVFGEVSYSCACFEFRLIVDDDTYSESEYENWRRAIEMVRSALTSERAWPTVSRLHLFVPAPPTPGRRLLDAKYADAQAFNAKA